MNYYQVVVCVCVWFFFSPPLAYILYVTVSLLFDAECQPCSWVAAVCSLQCRWIHLTGDKHVYGSLYRDCDCEWPTLVLLLGCDTVLDPRRCFVFWHEVEFSKKQELWQLKGAWLCDEQEWLLWKTLELDVLQVAKNRYTEHILLPL